MLGSRKKIRFTTVQLGPLRGTEVENALRLAGHTQRSFEFSELLHPKFALPAAKYKCPNGGWNLDLAVRTILVHRKFPRPVLFFSSLPYTDWDNRRKADWFYFADYVANGDEAVAIVSTHLWTTLPGDRTLQPYILLNLAAASLSYTVDLPMHDETRGCIFDYCDDPADIDCAIGVGELCQECERHLNAALRDGRISIEQLASARKLLNRAVGRRVAFLVMPFRSELEPIYAVMRKALESNGWVVVRADRIARPRRITDAIVQAILSSDLVVADLTGANPNVFYEVGLAHAAGCDVVLVTQDRAIPFDVSVERAVRYKQSVRGLSRLAKELGELTQ